MKRLFISIFILTILFNLGSCKSHSNTDSEISDLKQQVQDLQKEKDELKNNNTTTNIQSYSSHEIKNNDKTANIQENSKENTAAVISRTTTVTSKSLNYNQKITVNDTGEFSISSAKFTTRVNPSNPSGFYSYYQTKDTNYIYIDFIIKYKNLSSVDVEADDVGDINVTYDKHYEYSSFSVVEEIGGGDLTFASITDIDPLTTRTLHYICEVPKEVQNSGKSVVAAITIAEQTYRLKVK